MYKSTDTINSTNHRATHKGCVCLERVEKLQPTLIYVKAK